AEGDDGALVLEGVLKNVSRHERRGLEFEKGRRASSQGRERTGRDRSVVASSGEFGVPVRRVGGEAVEGEAQGRAQGAEHLRGEEAGDAGEEELNEVLDVHRGSRFERSVREIRRRTRAVRAAGRPRRTWP